jgi:hypothetical protein
LLVLGVRGVPRSAVPTAEETQVDLGHQLQAAQLLYYFTTVLLLH